jgi:hypothetical protein
VRGFRDILRIIATVSEISAKNGRGEECSLDHHEAEHQMAIWTRPLHTLFKMCNGMAIRRIVKCFASSVRDFVEFQKSGGAGNPAVLSTELKPTAPTVSLSANIAGLHGTLGEAVRASRDIGT